MTETLGPWGTYFGVIQRSPHYIEMFRHNKTTVSAYQIWGHRTLNGAYGDPIGSGVGGAGASAMFTVNSGQHFRSATIRRKGWGLYASNRRKQTHYVFDVDDFTTPGAGQPMPEDDEWLFLRTQENRLTAGGLLQFAGIPEATVTLAVVAATDRLVIKGIVFDFVAGANNLGGKAGTAGDPFLVGLGADDNAAAANLTLALNDVVDVGPAMDVPALANHHTFATNLGAPSAVVLIQPENATPVLVPGSAGQFTITTPDAPRIAIDAAALATGTLVFALDAANPVLGPIYCVPPPAFYGQQQAAFSLSGTAPSAVEGTPVVGSIPPFSDDITLATARPMHLVFAVPCEAITVRNTHATRDLLVSFGYGQPMINVAAGAEAPQYAGRTKEIILACTDAGGCTFSVFGVGL